MLSTEGEPTFPSVLTIDSSCEEVLKYYSRFLGIFKIVPQDVRLNGRPVYESVFSNSHIFFTGVFLLNYFL